MANDKSPATSGRATGHSPSPLDQSDELFMEEALRAAHRALEMGEVPVGAVLSATAASRDEAGTRISQAATPPLMPRSSPCAKLVRRR